MSAQDRQKAIELINEARIAGAREAKACAEIGLSLRTLQRWRKEEHLRPTPLCHTS
jgi:putative transposase